MIYQIVLLCLSFPPPRVGVIFSAQQCLCVCSGLEYKWFLSKSSTKLGVLRSSQCAILCSFKGKSTKTDLSERKQPKLFSVTFCYFGLFVNAGQFKEFALKKDIKTCNRLLFSESLKNPFSSCFNLNGTLVFHNYSIMKSLTPTIKTSLVVKTCLFL